MGIHFGFQGAQTTAGIHKKVPLHALGRLMQVEKGRTLLYISRKLVGDSAWPFKPGERVALTLDPKTKRLIVERHIGPAAKG